MAYALNQDIRYCLTNDRAAFLDLATDRYFCLPPQLDKAFQDVLSKGVNAEASDQVLASLLRSRILLEQATVTPAPSFSLPTPTSDCWASPIETGLHIDHVIALAYYGAAKLDVRSKRLKAIAEGLQSERSKLSNRRRHSDKKFILSDAARFRQIGAAVKVHDQCLIWSLAMVRYLFLKGFRPHLVLGVRLEPFAAHAWVQSDDVVLSCHVEEALLYTPILVA